MQVVLQHVGLVGFQKTDITTSVYAVDDNSVPFWWPGRQQIYWLNFAVWFSLVSPSPLLDNVRLWWLSGG